ncbi:hypothetical protein Tco_0370065 [Tanacetum coccineum]
MVKFCYDATLRPWFKEKPVKCEKTKKVEGGCDYAKEENQQEHDGSRNNDMDVDQMADQEDGANTSEIDDFVKGFEKGYLLREDAANTLPRRSQMKKLPLECKEMLRRKLNIIEAYNASKGRAAVKEKGEGSVNTTKEKMARCYIYRKRGYVFWKCPNKKNSTTLEAPTIDNQSKEPTMDNIWYVSSAYKKHMGPTKSLFKRVKNSFKVKGTQQERKIIFSHGIGEAMVETKDKEGCDGETDCATSKEGNGCDVETKSKIAKHNKYLEEYFDSIDSKDACPQIKGLEELKWDRNITWFKEEPAKCEKTKKVEGGYDHAKEENPQEHDRSRKNDTDVDQMADQEDGANTSETDDFMMQKGFEKGYLLREGVAYKLPRSSQKKRLSHEGKEMLRQKLNEIKA